EAGGEERCRVVDCSRPLGRDAALDAVYGNPPPGCRIAANNAGRFAHSQRTRSRNRARNRPLASSPPGALPLRQIGGSTPRSVSLATVRMTRQLSAKAL